MTLLIVTIPKSPWWSPWALAKEKCHTEQNQVNREVVQERCGSSWPRTAACSAYTVSLLFRHTQIYRDNLPNTVLFDVLLTWNHSDSQLTIATHYLLNISLLVEGLSHLESSFTSSRATLNHLCHSKRTFAQHAAISIHLLKHFKCLQWSFHQPDQNFRFIHSSVLTVEQLAKEKAQTKACEKKCNARRKLRLQLYTPKISC